MLFEVRGMDKSTGKARVARVKADDATGAERRAIAAGLSVTDVRPLDESPPPPPPPPPPPEPDEDFIPGFGHDAPPPAEDVDEDFEDDTEPSAAPPLAAMPLAYADAGTAAERVPDFRPLRFWAGLLTLASRIVLVVGIVVAVLGLLGGVWNGLDGGVLAIAIGAGTGLLTGGAILLSAAPLAVLGYAAEALREHVRRHWND